MLGCAAPPRANPHAELRSTFEHAAMGTLFRLTLYAPDETQSELAARAAFERIDAIERVATDYDARSEARALGRDAYGRWVRLSPDLARVVRAADRAVEISGGAFDPTVGPLVRLWRRALRDEEWPDAERWSAARARTGWERIVELDEREDGLHVRLAVPDVRLDFGGVAKGLAVDEALAELQRRGVRSALLDGGGDVAALDPPPGEAGWKVAVRPFAEAGASTMPFLLSGAAVATSGDAYRRGRLSGAPLPGIEEEDAEYGHVLDPRTALPLVAPRAAVMTAGSAAEADASATARLVLGTAATGVPELERGVFFGPPDADACVGALFPHDGVSPAKDPERESTYDLSD